MTFSDSDKHLSEFSVCRKGEGSFEESADRELRRGLEGSSVRDVGGRNHSLSAFIKNS
jgi:hypothetical protein